MLRIVFLAKNLANNDLILNQLPSKNQKKVAKKARFVSKLSLKSYICENLICQNDDGKRTEKRRKIQIL
jgi:hypothetical protein